MLEIKNIYTMNRDNNKTRLYCDIRENSTNKQIWFEVENQYAKYLCTERCDAFVIGLINYAARNKHDIISAIPATEELLYNINEYLIPSLSKYDKKMYSVKLNIPIAPAVDNIGAVGTGLSCGVDSFHVLAKQYNSKYPALNLTHLCINNVGAFAGGYENYGIQNVIEERYKEAQRVANKLNLPLIKTDSNFAQEFIQFHPYTHTYSSIFAVFCLQKLWKTYFYASSGFTFNDFYLKNNSISDSCHHELLSLSCFSTNKLRLYSEGGAQDRLEKVKDITDFDLAQQHLHVCTELPTNCGQCSKCRRTILELYVLNKLDNFKNVFDVDYFYKHKLEYLFWLYSKYVICKDKINEPTYKAIKKEYNILIKIMAPIWGLRVRLARKINKLMEKK